MIPNGIRKLLIVVLRAIAVTIPGSAIGRTSRNDTLLRPKNRNRWTANAAALPSARANRVAIVATSSEFASASRTWGLRHAIPNHFVVNSWIGHACATLSLNAYRTMIASGTYRNTSSIAESTLIRFLNPRVSIATGPRTRRRAWRRAGRRP